MKTADVAMDILRDLERGVRDSFPNLSDKDKKKVDDLLKATLWLYEDSNEREGILEEAFLYLQLGGNDLQVFFTALSYKALSSHSARVKIIRNSFMNGTRVDDEIVNTLSHDESELAAWALWALIWGRVTVELALFASSYKGEQEVDFIHLHEMWLEANRNSW